ncbi:MAG: hypothetical protein ABF651_01850 [Sporolactobacillus sp.]
MISLSDDDWNQRTIITGNWLQALGGSLSLQSTLETKDYNLGQALAVLGDLLQIIGNSLQALSGAYQLREVMDSEETDTINFSGSWIQAVGAVLSFLSALPLNSKTETDS